MQNSIRSLLAVLILAPAALGAGVRYVDDSAPIGGDGTSWASAYVFLNDALAEASDPKNLIGEIRVAQGTYRPDVDATSGSFDRTETFHLISTVKVLGGYLGLSAGGGQSPNDRDVAANVTTLSGDLLGDDDPPFFLEDNSFHIVTGSGTGATAILDGFRILAGNASSSGDGAAGGGVFNSLGSPTIRNCTFVRCIATEFGGAIHNTQGSSPAISDTSFVDNAAQFGGAVSNFAGSTTSIIACTFEGNEAATFGGGLFNSSGADPSVADSTFSGNTAGGSGGAIYTSGAGSVTVSGTTLCENTPDNYAGPLVDGGGNDFMATCASPCPADLNGSGEVGFDDILVIIGQWGPCPACIADLNESGEVGFDDILIVIGGWGLCP